MFYDTPHLFFNTRFANNPPWGAQITLDQSRRRLRRSVSRPIRAAIRSRRSTPAGRRSRSRRSASTSTRRSTREPTSLQQWNVSAQRQIGDWLADRELSRQPLEPPVARDRAELRGLRARARRPATTNQRRVARAAEPGRRGSSTAPSASSTTPAAPTTTACCCRLQRRLKSSLSVLSNYTLSKCMSDPATTEITGPTIVDPTNPDLDYSYCDVGPPPRRQRLARGADARRSRTTR